MEKTKEFTAIIAEAYRPPVGAEQRRGVEAPGFKLENPASQV